MPLLPTAASRLKSWTADAGEDKGGAGKPGLSIKQVLYYLGLLLLGMFVAVLMEQTEDNAATKNTSSKRCSSPTIFSLGFIPLSPRNCSLPLLAAPCLYKGRQWKQLL